LEIRTHDPAGIVGIHKKNDPHLSDGVERMGYGSLYPVRTQGARVVLELKRSRFLLEETRKEKLERLKMGVNDNIEGSSNNTDYRLPHHSQERSLL
jgi:hypothetical protein